MSIKAPRSSQARSTGADKKGRAAMARTVGLLLASAATAVLAAAAPAWAADPSADTSASGSTIAEVVVTAQKRVQKLQDVPISMEVLSGAKLNSFDENDFRDIQNFVPNVFVESSAGNNVIYIRGFGSPPANYGFDQSVSLYEDGVYLGRSKQSQTPFFDLDRVEVLRGPQGALFGKNTPAGAVSVVTAGPTSTFQGAVTGLYNFDLKGYDITAFVAGPITSTLSARLAVRFVDQDGYLLNLYTGDHDPHTREQMARATVKWAPNSTFNYTVKSEYSNQTINGGMNVSDPLDTTSVPGTTRYVSPSGGGLEFNQTDTWLVSGTGNLSLGDYTLTSVTSYTWFKGSSTNGFDQIIPGSGGQITGNTVANGFPERFHQFSQEIRLLSPTGHKLEYVVGAYYDISRYQVQELFYYDILGGLFDGTQDSFFDQHAHTVSVFGQATYHVLDRLRLVGSLRYTDTAKDATYDAVTFKGLGLQPLSSAAGSLNEGDVDPSATLQYDFAPRIMGYLTFGQGSKSGGFVANTYGTTSSTFSFLPERSTNYEAGLKATLLGGRFVADAAVFNTSFKDLQVSVFDSATQNFLTGNAASATSRGVELSLAWYPIDNLDITGSAAYQNPTYDNYPGASCLATQPISQCNPADPASVAANNIKGTQLAYTSKFTGNIQVHYRQKLADNLKLDSTVAVSGRSGYFPSDNLDPNFGYQPAFAKVDTRLQLSPLDDRWHIALVGKNLTNAETVGMAFDLPFPITNAPRALKYVEETRNISLEVGVKF
jgi:iron complex outermembrane receptor protein